MSPESRLRESLRRAALSRTARPPAGRGRRSAPASAPTGAPSPTQRRRLLAGPAWPPLPTARAGLDGAALLGCGFAASLACLLLAMASPSFETWEGPSFASGLGAGSLGLVFFALFILFAGAASAASSFSARSRARHCRALSRQCARAFSQPGFAQRALAFQALDELSRRWSLMDPADRGAASALERRALAATRALGPDPSGLDALGALREVLDGC